MTDQELVEHSLRIAGQAAATIMAHYQGEISVVSKSDGSPVTDADREADTMIVRALRTLTPDIPVVSEESVAAGDIPDVSGGTFWLVDPLDGTRGFIDRTGDFSVNIGLIRHGDPALGVILAPIEGRSWCGIVGHGAFEQGDGDIAQPITVREADPAALTVVASRSHRNPALEQYIADNGITHAVARGSAVKFCLVARGDADLYPRTSPTMEWDTAAGHAILVAAGGTMTSFDGSRFRYGKPGFLNGCFMVRGRLPPAATT